MSCTHDMNDHVHSGKNRYEWWRPDGWVHKCTPRPKVVKQHIITITMLTSFQLNQWLLRDGSCRCKLHRTKRRQSVATDCVGRDGLEPVIVQVEQHHLRLCSLQNQVTKLLHLQNNNTAVIQTHLLCIVVSCFLPTSPSQLQGKSDIGQRVQIQISPKKRSCALSTTKATGHAQVASYRSTVSSTLTCQAGFLRMQANLKRTKKKNNTIR